MKSKRPKLNLKGKLVFITGGGMGLGKCMAFEFLSKGAKVVICDLKQEVLDSASKIFSFDIDFLKNEKMKNS